MRNCEDSRNFVLRHRIHTVYDAKRDTICKVEMRTLMSEAYVQWACEEVVHRPAVRLFANGTWSVHTPTIRYTQFLVPCILLKTETANPVLTEYRSA